VTKVSAGIVPGIRRYYEIIQCPLWVITRRSLYPFWAAAFGRLPATRRYVEWMGDNLEIFEFVDPPGSPYVGYIRPQDRPGEALRRAA